ncbi:MAG: hypothetical protein RLZZ229_693 [Actinomycetota bacterium]
MARPNPIIPGFNPDPSIVRVGDDYYIVNSTFEYLPGLPIYHSRDLDNWALIGHVANRPGQFKGAGVKPPGGAWAPTIRYRDGVFYVVVTDFFGRGNLLFTAENPAGPWSDGIELAIGGIDPDLAWDEDGTCYLSVSGLSLGSHEGFEGHNGISQVRINHITGEVLEEPRHLWQGSGLMFAEGPHLYHIGDYWYLLTAEGGTDRGHAVSIGRSTSPTGPWENNPANPLITAAGSSRGVQNTGHADLFEDADGNWHMAMLGVRPRGMIKAYSPVGRETFMTDVRWVDGWPVVDTFDTNESTPQPEFTDTFRDESFNLEWMAVRNQPQQVASIDAAGLTIIGVGEGLDSLTPAAILKRQRLLLGTATARIKVEGTGGLMLRYNEVTHYEIEISDGALAAKANLSTISQSVEAANFDESALDQDGFATLFITFRQDAKPFTPEILTCDYVDLGYLDASGQRQIVASFDGKFMSSEVLSSFTGRAIGFYSITGKTVVREYSELATK